MAPIVMAMYHPDPDVVSTQIEEGEVVLLDLETQQYYTLNETGSRVWEGVEAGQTTDKIAAALADEYAVTEQNAREYLQEFLEELICHDLVNQSAPD